MFLRSFTYSGKIYYTFIFSGNYILSSSSIITFNVLYTFIKRTI